MPLPIFSSEAWVGAGRSFELISGSDRQFDGEARPRVGLALDAEASAERLHDTFGDGQSEPCSLGN
jgi:hypothetical protein